MYWDGSAGKADSDSDWDEKTLKLKKHYGNTQVLKVDDADVLLLLLDELGDETRNEINRLSKMGFRARVLINFATSATRGAN